MVTRAKASGKEIVVEADERYISKEEFQAFKMEVLAALQNWVAPAQQTRLQPEVNSTAPTYSRQEDARNNNQSYAGITRLPKIDFPRFDSSCVQDWIFKVEQFFEMDGTEEITKVKLAFIHFDGAAATWYRSLCQSFSGSSICKSWYSYEAELLGRFSEVLDDLIAELKKLQETNGIVDYHGKFELLKTRVNLPEKYLVSQYLAGLRIETQMHIRMFMPKATMDCLMLGKLYEQAHPTISSQATCLTSRNVVSNSPYIAPMKARKEQEVKRVDANATGRKFLTNEEIADKKAKWLCFYCDEKFSREHLLTKHKKNQLYLFEIDEDEFASKEEETRQEEAVIDIAKISVNAVSGVGDYTTMKVYGQYDNSIIYILIDFGSTYNFIDEGTAAKLNCKIQNVGLARVTVADGIKLRIKGKIDGFGWKFHDQRFETDLMIITLGGCDMVLGVQWLEAL